MMRKATLLFLLIALTVFSCSTDGEEEAAAEMEASALVGTWVLQDVRLEDSTDTRLNLFDEIVDRLVEENCELVSFTFNADGTASSTERLNFIEINATPTGLDVPCPTGSETEMGTWSLNEDELMLVSEDGEEQQLTIVLEQDTLIIDGEDIDNNNISGGKAVFVRQ